MVDVSTEGIGKGRESLHLFHFSVTCSNVFLLHTLNMQVRVVDVGTEGIGKGQVTTLARGVLPLTAAAMQVLQSR